MTYPSPEAENQGHVRYEQQKLDRQQIDTNSPSMTDSWALTWKMPTPQGVVLFFLPFFNDVLAASVC